MLRFVNISSDIINNINNKLDKVYKFYKTGNKVYYLDASSKPYTFKLIKKVYGKLTAILIIFHETHNVQDLFFINAYDGDDSVLGDVHVRPILAPFGTKITADKETFTIFTKDFGVFMVCLTPKFYESVDFLDYFEQLK